MIFEPHARVKNTFYKCDSKFYLDEILEMYKDHDVNGVIYTDGNECVWYELKSRDFRKIASKTIYLQNQFKNGGQSTNRLARNREIQRDQYIQMLAEKTVELFYDKKNNYQKVSNLMICGPAEFKVDLSAHRLILSFFKSVHNVTMGTLDQNIILQTIANLSDPVDKKNVDNIRYMITLADEKLVFGDEIKPMIENCELKTLYVHESLDIEKTLLPGYKLEFVKIKSDMINEYGGMIGVKYY